ncbi:MAG: hypothetical protein Q8R25_03045 [bacterium]|nr:hypothetical protein [bacterium]
MLEIENQNTPVPEPSHNWFSAHPLTMTMIGAGTLFVVGAIIVMNHSAATVPPPSATAWSGDVRALLNPTAFRQDTDTMGLTHDDIMRQVQENPPYTYTLSKLGTEKNPPQATTPGESFDYKVFIDSITQQESKIGAPKPVTGTTDITYAFPPDSLFSTTSAATERTETQQALYNYGNEVGSYIQSYEQQHPDQTQVLKNQIEDRNNAEKVQAVIRMAHDLQNVGRHLLEMDNVPAQVTTKHQTLAKSYEKIGTHLALVPTAQNNDDLLKAVTTYNVSADDFVKNFVALVSAFSTYGVTFGPDEEGGVFTFTYSSGL